MTDFQEILDYIEWHHKVIFGDPDANNSPRGVILHPVVYKDMLKLTRYERHYARHARMLKGKHGLKRPK